MVWCIHTERNRDRDRKRLGPGELGTIGFGSSPGSGVMQNLATHSFRVPIPVSVPASVNTPQIVTHRMRY